MTDRTDQTPFLIGAERSGTTLLRIMLDHHPELAFRNEFEFAVDLVGDDGSFPPMDDYVRFLRLSRTFSMSGFEIDRQLAYPDLVKSFLEQKRRRDGKRLVGATIHRHFHRILTIWPGARFIHLIRDGRDVARSRIREGWAGNGWAASHEWVQVEREIDRLIDRVGPDRVVEIRYEDLLADPESELTRICGFLGLGWSPEMLEFEKDSTYRKPDPRFAQRWRSEASPRQVALIEAVQGEMLARRGYELSGNPPHRVGRLGRWWLGLHSRLVCAWFRLRRYGPRLWASEIISRRLKMTRWQEKTRLAINEIQKRHLK